MVFPWADDEIDLSELFIALWKGKWIIIATIFIFAVGAVCCTPLTCLIPTKPMPY
ncbi:Wzz/FepE/Etk N-terminal domain-containing protein [Aeromonas media]